MATFALGDSLVGCLCFLLRHFCALKQKSNKLPWEVKTEIEDMWPGEWPATSRAADRKGDGPRGGVPVAGAQARRAPRSSPIPPVCVMGRVRNLQAL